MFFLGFLRFSLGFLGFFGCLLRSKRRHQRVCSAGGALTRGLQNREPAGTMRVLCLEVNPASYASYIHTHFPLLSSQKPNTSPYSSHLIWDL